MDWTFLHAWIRCSFIETTGAILASSFCGAADVQSTCVIPPRYLYGPPVNELGDSVAPGIPLTLIAESVGRSWTASEVAGTSNLPRNA